MTDILDRIELDDRQARDVLAGLGLAAAQHLGETGVQSAEAFEASIGGVAGVAKSLSKEIARLNRQATLDLAKAASGEYRDALKRAADASKALSAATDETDGSTRRLGESMFTTANQALGLGQKSIQAAQALVEFARRGADASRATALFRGDIEGLRAASGRAIDDTALQNLDTMARRTGLASSEIESLTRLATKFREPGQQMTDVFRQLVDASPEQLEKWGVLTSEMVESLKGLDTVQQKQALRQALVAEGMAITNEEIAAQTSNVETLNARWENAVSSVQAWTASLLDSDGAKAATDRFTASLAGLGDMLGIIGGAWSDVDDELGTDGLLGTIVESSTGLLTLGRLWGDMTDASQVALGAVQRFQDDQRAGWGQLRNEMQQTIDAMNAAAAANAQRREENGDDLPTEELMLSDWSKDGTKNLGRSDPRKGRGRIKDPNRPRGGGRDRQQETPDYGAALAGAIAPGFGYGNSDGASAMGVLGGLFAANDDGLISSVDAGLTSIQDRYSSAFDTIADEAEGAFNRISAAMSANEQLALSVATATSDAFLSTFENVIAGGDSFRASMLGVIGELWGQLSAGFLAWATAEGNLLAGNPWGAFAAAAALGVVGAAVSGLSRRGSGGGSSSTGTAAQRFNENSRAREAENRETKISVEVVGIPVPDSVARELAGAVARESVLAGRAA